MHGALRGRGGLRPSGGATPAQQQRTRESKALKQRTYGPNYIPEEETVRNDYSRHYIVSSSRPQNHVQNPHVASRFSEYPRLRRLLEAKREAVDQKAHPPAWLQRDLREWPVTELLPGRFDVILIDPPLKEYYDLHPSRFPSYNPETPGRPPWWTWEELEALPVPQIAASPGFIFIWCGNGQGPSLEQGRALLGKWGYRKCEDLVWIKTNALRKADDEEPGSGAVFTPTKEHCLMGIRGTVRRSTDGHFVHCNVDTDVIIAESDPEDPLAKPEEIYNLIENFCLGARRLELFGSSRSLRRGWLTVGPEAAPRDDGSHSNDEVQGGREYVKDEYQAHFIDEEGRIDYLVPTTAEIESLRPRSPPARGATPVNAPGQLPRGLGNASAVGSGSAATGGRNTVSHPSGGLGRGPGNAFQPGMRVSGVREAAKGPAGVVGTTSGSFQQSMPGSMPVAYPQQMPAYGPLAPRYAGVGSAVMQPSPFDMSPMIANLPGWAPPTAPYQQLPYASPSSSTGTFDYGAGMGGPAYGHYGTGFAGGYDSAFLQQHPLMWSPPPVQQPQQEQYHQLAHSQQQQQQQYEYEAWQQWQLQQQQQAQYHPGYGGYQ